MSYGLCDFLLALTCHRPFQNFVFMGICLNLGFPQILLSKTHMADYSDHAVTSEYLLVIICWDRGFKSRRPNGYLSLANVV
jgi:hypothetical protein